MSQFGHRDERVPVVSDATKACVALLLFAVTLPLLWHVAVVWTTALPLDGFERTWAAITAWAPLAVAGAARHPVSTITVFVLLVVVEVVVWAVLAQLLHRPGRGLKGFATRGQVRAALGIARARQRAAYTCPALTKRQVRRAPPARIGLPLGTSTTGVDLIVPLETHLMVQTPTGGGKTSQVIIPAVISAPGAVVVTSTKADVVDATADDRARKGRLWVFDPTQRVGWPEPMVWDPIAGCIDGEAALERGMAFAAGAAAKETDSSNAGFFRGTATSALTRLLHAAALDGRSMGTVVEWAMTLDKGGADQPLAILRDSDHPGTEAMLAALHSVTSGADNTVSSTRMTLGQIVEPLALPHVLRWVLPRDGVPTFDPAAFAASTDTLYIISDDSKATNTAPLTTMLLEAVLSAVKDHATRRGIGQPPRLDPPLRVVGDELANIAPVPKLPAIASDIRNAAQLVLSLQSQHQAELRWGAPGAKVLLEMMGAELVLPGVKDVDTLRRVSGLMGDVELERLNRSYQDSGSRTGISTRVETRPVMRPDEIRTIPERHGLLLFGNTAPIMLTLQRWDHGRSGRRRKTAAGRTADRRSFA